MAKEKVNVFQNASAEEISMMQAEHSLLEDGRIPLRIDARTMVLVKPEHCNAKYAAKVREKFEKIHKREYNKSEL